MRRRKGVHHTDEINITTEELEKSLTETDKKVLKKWAESKLKKQRFKAASNPNTPMASLKRLQGYPEENPLITYAAKNNPQMFETDLEKIIKQANSRVKNSRIKAAKNPNSNVNVINHLLDDTEEEVAMIAARHPSVDESSFETILKLGGMKVKVYGAFADNENFKKAWLPRWFEMFAEAGIASRMYVYLEDEKWFDNENEWIDLLKIIDSNMPDYTSGSLKASFWKNFFQYPDFDYTEKMIITVLEMYGDIIKVEAFETFDFIMRNNGKAGASESVRNKLYEITQNEEYLPDEVKDIFVF